MSNEIEKIHGEIVIYTAADGNTKITLLLPTDIPKTICGSSA